jgi:hypothetical protein
MRSGWKKKLEKERERQGGTERRRETNHMYCVVREGLRNHAAGSVVVILVREFFFGVWSVSTIAKRSSEGRRGQLIPAY